jgi:hypothetical protein
VHVLVGIAWIGATGWLITGLFFAQGDQRAFCIGALVAATSAWTGIGGQFLEGVAQLLWQLLGSTPTAVPTTQLLKHLALAVAALANGWLCVRARHYFQNSSRASSRD